MSFSKVTPQRNTKMRQNPTTGSDFPLRTTHVKNYEYQNELALKTEREIKLASHYGHHMDGLCINTMENLCNSIADEEKIETRERRVLPCYAVLIFMVCVVSLISLVLTLLMLTGGVSAARCGCLSTKDQSHRSKPVRMSGLHYLRGEVISGSEFESWLMNVLRNITENMDKHSSRFYNLKDAFSNLKEETKKNEKIRQESIEEAKRELGSKINVMEATMTDIRSAVESLNKSSINLPQRRFNRHEIFNISFVFNNMTRLQNQLKQECKTNYSQIQTKLEKINSKIDKLQTTSNRTAEELFSTSTKLHQKIKKVERNASYELNLTRDELKSSLQEISSELLEAKTYFIKKIANISKTKDLRDVKLGSTTGYNGSTGANGNTAKMTNFSQCEYKNKTSGGLSKYANGSTMTVDVVLLEPKGKRIVGVTCSTNGAQEYNFIRHKASYTSGKNAYQCICKGKSGLFFPTGTKIYCYLHYWECPIF